MSVHRNAIFPKNILFEGEQEHGALCVLYLETLQREGHAGARFQAGERCAQGQRVNTPRVLPAQEARALHMARSHRVRGTRDAVRRGCGYSSSASSRMELILRGH